MKTLYIDPGQQLTETSETLCDEKHEAFPQSFSPVATDMPAQSAEKVGIIWHGAQEQLHGLLDLSLVTGAC